MYRTDVVYLLSRMPAGIRMTARVCGDTSSLGSRIRSVLSLKPDAVAIEGADGKTT